MSNSAEFQGLLRHDRVALIQEGANQSQAIDLVGTNIVGMQIPEGFAGTNITFLSSYAFDGVYRAVRNDQNSLLTVTCSANNNYAFVPFDLASIRFIKLQSSSPQTQDTEIVLVSRPL